MINEQFNNKLRPDTFYVNIKVDSNEYKQILNGKKTIVLNDNGKLSNATVLGWIKMTDNFALIKVTNVTDLKEN